MKKLLKSSIFGLLLSVSGAATSTENPLPDTGVGGVYEVMIGTDDCATLLKYLREFGFVQIDKSQIGREKARLLYGGDSALTSYRLQNRATESHGLIRILE